MLTSKTYVGSKRLFTSLLLTMLEKNKIGLGVLVPRTNSTPTHVLIIPQAEKTENDDPQAKQTEPPGFHLIQLAFADDIRSINIASSVPCVTPDEDGERTAFCLSALTWPQRTRLAIKPLCS